MSGFFAGLAAGAALTGLAVWLWSQMKTRRLARFFSFAAHEINTPITAINMTVLNLLSGVFGELPKDQLQWMELMREQVARLNGMIGELRDLIHLDLHRDMATHVEPVVLEEAVEIALRAVRHGCVHAGVGLAVDVPRGLPRVVGDPDRLARTLTSLLFHARKFRLSGGISVLARPGAGPMAEVVVEFTGPAMSPAEVERSLEMYFPARQKRDQVQSATGLGLGVPRAIMRKLGGDVAMDVAPDGSTRLALLVPKAG